MTGAPTLAREIEAFLAKTKDSDDFRLQSRRNILFGNLRLLADSPTEATIANIAETFRLAQEYAANPKTWPHGQPPKDYGRD